MFGTGNSLSRRISGSVDVIAQKNTGGLLVNSGRESSGAQDIILAVYEDEDGENGSYNVVTFTSTDNEAHIVFQRYENGQRVFIRTII